jgi:hypothetical protein
MTKEAPRYRQHFPLRRGQRLISAPGAFAPCSLAVFRLSRQDSGKNSTTTEQTSSRPTSMQKVHTHFSAMVNRE